MEEFISLDPEVPLHLSYDLAVQHLATVYTVNDGMKEAPYSEVTKLKNVKNKEDLSVRAPGVGQAKLVAVEMRFFELNINSMRGSRDRTFASKDFKGYRSVVMYIGASDGHHISQFTQIYPATLFVLVDRRAPHAGLRDAKFRNTYFLNEEWHGQDEVGRFFENAEGPGPAILASKVPVLFISDIQSVNTRRMKTEDGDKRVLEDEATQDTVLAAVRERLDVAAYMLKFRAPYSFKEGEKGERAAGDLWVQAYAPHSSTELRIVGRPPKGSKPIGRVTYDIGRIEGVMSHINTVVRTTTPFDAYFVACIVAVMRHNRKGQNLKGRDDTEDVIRFKQTILNYNIPIDAAKLVKYSVPHPTPELRLDLKWFMRTPLGI